MQDHSNWDDKFFTHDVFVKKKITTTDQDADPEEVQFEEEQESVESSDSGFWSKWHLRTTEVKKVVANM